MKAVGSGALRGGLLEESLAQISLRVFRPPDCQHLEAYAGPRW